MRHIVCIGGVPGTGKTTLVRSILQTTGTWQTVRPTRLLHAMFHVEYETYVLGKYSDDDIFAGTDRLSMAVQPDVLPWVAGHTSHVIFEGDRLFTLSLLHSLASLPNTHIHIIVLDAPKSCLQNRYLQRGSNQSEKFLKGRHTKIHNILNDTSLQKYTRVINSDECLDHLVHDIIHLVAPTH